MWKPLKMKKLYLTILTLFIPLVVYAANTYTTNYGLGKPAKGDRDWNVTINQNFDTIDSTLKTISNATGDADSDSNWILHNNYPAPCPSGQYVTAIGDTLVCSTPAGTGGGGSAEVNWSEVDEDVLVAVNWDAYAGGESVWDDCTGGICYTGNVGVNNTAPTSAVDVTGVVTASTGVKIGTGVDTTMALLSAYQETKTPAMGWDSTAGCFSFSDPVCIAGNVQANLGLGLYVNSDGNGTPEGNLQWDSDTITKMIFGDAGNETFQIGGATNYVKFSEGGVVTFEGTASIVLPNETVSISTISASGTASGSTYLRGDGSWGTPGSSANINWDSFPIVDTIESDWNFIVNDGGVDKKINWEDFEAILGTSYSVYADASANVSAEGQVAIDLTDDQFTYYGSAKRVLPYERTVCAIVENLSASDDNFAFYMANDPITVTGVGCNCRGTCSTLATFTLEDRGGNAMTITDTNPTCATTGAATFKAVTSGNTLTAGEMVAFDVTNTPTTGDTYALCITYTVNAQ
jgi:hypothetical protein